MPSLEQMQLEIQLKSEQIKRKVMPKIVIIDDDLELLQELQEILASNNYDVEIVPNSALAFAVVCEFKPDLILLDMKMKPKSGFQLAEEFSNSSKTKSIPIVAVTGFFTEKEHLLMMKMFGMKHAVLKPFNPTVLIAKIEEVLAGAQSKPTLSQEQ